MVTPRQKWAAGYPSLVDLDEDRLTSLMDLQWKAPRSERASGAYGFDQEGHIVVRLKRTPSVWRVSLPAWWATLGKEQSFHDDPYRAVAQLRDPPTS